MTNALEYYNALGRFDAAKCSFKNWAALCAANARRAEWRAKLREAARQAVTSSIDAEGGEALLASSGSGGRDVDKMIDAIDSRLALDRAHGPIWAACVAVRCGFGLSEISDKLGIPRTTLRRALLRFGKEVRRG